MLPVAVDPELVKMLALDKLTLSADQTRRVQRVFQRHQAAFSQHELDLGQTNLVSHSIDTQNNAPFRIKTRPVPLKAQDWLRAEIERLLKAQITEPSISPYSSPIVIVPKKVQPGEAPKFRLCIDYRWLNEQTKRTPIRYLR